MDYYKKDDVRIISLGDGSEGKCPLGMRRPCPMIAVCIWDRWRQGAIKQIGEDSVNHVLFGESFNATARRQTVTAPAVTQPPDLPAGVCSTLTAKPPAPAKARVALTLQQPAHALVGIAGVGKPAMAGFGYEAFAVRP